MSSSAVDPAEDIQDEAVICRYCHQSLDPKKGLPRRIQPSPILIAVAIAGLVGVVALGAFLVPINGATIVSRAFPSPIPTATITPTLEPCWIQAKSFYSQEIAVYQEWMSAQQLWQQGQWDPRGDLQPFHDIRQKAENVITPRCVQRISQALLSMMDSYIAYLQDFHALDTEGMADQKVIFTDLQTQWQSMMDDFRDKKPPYDK